MKKINISFKPQLFAIVVVVALIIPVLGITKNLYGPRHIKCIK